MSQAGEISPTRQNKSDPAASRPAHLLFGNRPVLWSQSKRSSALQCRKTFQGLPSNVSFDTLCRIWAHTGKPQRAVRAGPIRRQANLKQSQFTNVMWLHFLSVDSSVKNLACSEEKTLINFARHFYGDVIKSSFIPNTWRIFICWPSSSPWPYH